MTHKLGFSRRGALLGVLASLAAVGLAIPASAAAKVTSLTSCGTISSPGKYRLDADVSTTSLDCFDITASDVTLHLNGHTVTAGTFGFVVKASGSGDQIVGPGTVTGANTRAIGLFVGGNDTVRGVTVSVTGSSEGIEIGSAGNDVRGNVVTGTGTFGIVVDSLATGNTIIGNFAHGSGTDLVDNNVNCDSNVWRGNDFGSANQTCIH
jgi:hypothetical protein